jgi:hypothetical protein
MSQIPISQDDPTNKNIDYLMLQKMAFLYNALEEGWTIKKDKDKYIFKKNHEGKKEVFLDSYLKQFLTRNFDINTIIK